MIDDWIYLQIYKENWRNLQQGNIQIGISNDNDNGFKLQNSEILISVSF